MIFIFSNQKGVVYMMLETYLTVDEYKAMGGTIPDEEIDELLISASRNIDSLTFNRIVSRGIENLTEFQQEILKRVVFNLANFSYNNSDVIDSCLSSYSINGTSMAFTGNNSNVKTINGVVIKSSDYALLSQTGLTCRSLSC